MALDQLVILSNFQASLIPFSEEQLAPLGLPQDVFAFLTQTGLPTHSFYELGPNAPVRFLKKPEIKTYFHFRGDYLHFADMDVMGELAVDIYSKKHESTQFIDERTAPSHVNSSIGQFIECFGAWQALYPQYQDAVRQAIFDDLFCLFDHPEIYGPHLGRLESRLREIDPDALKWRKFFWRRMCEPDVF
ncbi:hypothetical protein D3Z52_03605 [Clostridiaceae bacterium]|nr:hypothetical protein [Clostridiaceae bacterium]